ncbi:probable nuclear inhibitor of protein phosphatase 1 at N-terminal half [Coccomyxa sp. Obi]|nr:probable nuclear inhibitor of protein phosphatase 1 at N-terminal half [Coccomyxa sp. Obi]
MADHITDWAQVPKQKGFVVEARHPDGKKGRVALDDRAGILFGRNGQVCNCEVAHKSASRVHACLAYDGEKFQIQDLASSHGTFVDGERLEKSAKAHVVPGKTVITIGRCLNEYILLLDSVDNREGDREGIPELDHRRSDGSLEARRDGHVREHSHRNTGGSEARAGDYGHEHRNEALPQRQREASRGQASRGDADARPSNRDGLREEMRHRRPPEGSYRGAGHRDTPRGSGRGRDSYMRHDVQHGRARDSGREVQYHGSGRGHHVISDSRRYDHPDRRDQQRSGRRSGSPKAQRRRSDAESEEEDKAHARAAEERRRKRKSAFDDAPASAPASTQQQTPAQIVMGMMGGGGMPTGMLNAEQKKKLLWGKKAEQVEAAPVEAFGANRWDTAEFANDSEKEKFIKLMGVKMVPTVPTAAMAQAQPASPTEREALTREKQDRLLHNVEAQFMAGLRRADGRTVGLGL